MQITKRSPFSGKEHTMDIDVTKSQLKSWKDGKMIQDAFPHLTADEREFLLTGITKEEWDAEFGED
jgi:hypothetical protein